MLTRAMREEGLRYRRIENTVLVPLVPVFDGGRPFASWADFVANTEWRIASPIVNGSTARGCAPPPEAVRRLDEGIKGKCGVPPGRQPNGQVVHPRGVQVSNGRVLFRAAVIRVEGMPQPLPVLEGPSAHWDKRAGPPKNGPAPQRW